MVICSLTNNNFDNKEVFEIFTDNSTDTLSLDKRIS